MNQDNFVPTSAGFVLDIDSSDSLRRMKDLLVSFCQTRVDPSEDKVYLYESQRKGFDQFIGESIARCARWETPIPYNVPKAVKETFELIHKAKESHFRTLVYITDRIYKGQVGMLKRIGMSENLKENHIKVVVITIGEVDSNLEECVMRFESGSFYNIPTVGDLTLEVFKDIVDQLPSI